MGVVGCALRALCPSPLLPAPPCIPPSGGQRTQGTHLVLKVSGNKLGFHPGFTMPWESGHLVSANVSLLSCKMGLTALPRSTD